MRSIVRELRPRNIFRIAVAYTVVGWLVLQVVGAVETAAGLPSWTDGMALVILITGFPVILFIAWAFELTPEGLKKTDAVDPEQSITHKTGRVFDFAIVGALVLVAGLIGWQQVSGPGDAPQLAEQSNSVDNSNAIEVAETVAPDVVANGGLESSVSEPPAKSVAVIPFLALSSDEEDGYFADGLTEEILNSLAYVPELLVTSRTSAFQFRGPDIPSVPEIASQLGVAHILEGSVRRSGDQVRVTAQLIRASDDAHLWSQTYDRTLDDVFAIQEDVAENVARVLEVVLDDTARARMNRSGARNVEAFVAFQQGWDIWAQMHAIDEEDRLNEARPYFEEATRLDPNFSEAYLLQSDEYSHVMTSLAAATEFDRVAFDDAHAEHSRLLELAENSSRDPIRRAIAQANRILFSDDWTGAIQILERAMDPESCAADNYLNTLAEYLAPSQDILEYYRAQARCDPLNSTTWRVLSNAALRVGQFDAGLEAQLRSSELRDNDSGFLVFLESERALSEGRVDDAERIVNEPGIDPFARAFLVLRIASLRGDAETARAMADQLLDVQGIPPRFQALIHAMAGDREAANAVAAQVDERPLSAVRLREVINICSCGAFFDLEYAPNFAARLEEAGFPWPPEPDYGFALKDW